MDEMDMMDSMAADPSTAVEKKYIDQWSQPTRRWCVEREFLPSTRVHADGYTPSSKVAAALAEC